MGYQLRGAGLDFEIVSPETCESLHDWETGEVVFTGLNRTGKSLIQYGSGGVSRFFCETIIDRNCISGELQISVTLADTPFTVTGARRKIEVRTR